MLEIRDLVKVYPGPVAALQGVRLDIAPGMFGLLGPNGAGKTTLMRILAGLLEPTAGQVTFEGEDILRAPQRLWPKLGFLPQEFGFYPHLTGEAMLDFLLKMKGVTASGRSRKTLVAELLERVNLTGAAKRRVRDYSGGMRQRLGIAQAIAGDPRLLIVDEPTAGLDPEERHRFYRILTELAEDRTVILSTHIVEDVAVLCHRFAIIQQGRVVAETTPGAIRSALASSVFEGAPDAAEREAVWQTHVVLREVVSEGERWLRVYRPDGQAPDGFRPVPPSLEDAYLAVTRGAFVPPAAALPGVGVLGVEDEAHLSGTCSPIPGTEHQNPALEEAQ